MGFFRSIRRNLQLSTIMADAGAYCRSGDIGDLPRTDRGRKALYTHILADPDLSAALLEHNASEQTLDRIYWGIFRNLGGQWIGNTFLPVAAMTAEHSLRYLLNNVAALDPEKQNEAAKRVILTLYEYYRRGGNGPL
jgi:hypothetical protein